MRFKDWLNEEDDIVGLYPPEYGGIGNYPPEYFNPSNVYIRASREEGEHKKKKKKHKKKT